MLLYCYSLVTVLLRSDSQGAQREANAGHAGDRGAPSLRGRLLRAGAQRGAGQPRS